MAKKWKSLWENYSADGSDKTKKSAELEAHKKWYYEDENNAEEKERTVIGFNTSYTDDDIKSDTDYGGYGYSGYGHYDSFDDSDRDWYRRGKFRYSRQADYSPSSQFRTFSGRYTYYGTDDEAKNKAIRALRNLTRSANTIIDKTNSGQQSFAVQFSSGTDSNGTSAELAEENRRIVYVCPDDLLATKTPEDEDACIDALTGFVLLRVQIAQDVAPESAQEINATGLHTVGFRAAELLFANKDKLCEINAEKFSRDVTDEYMAGMLAKSMLTRLARRSVVANWGGFAPYFVRHAKKFASVREHLEKAEMSVERIVGVMGYNMLADENQIELPAEIDAIASKHLGVEIEHGRLLDVCRELIAELRKFELQKFMATDETPVLPGPIESALAAMMNQAKDAQTASKTSNDDMRNFLSSIAGAMGAAAEAGATAGADAATETAANTAMLNNLKTVHSIEQLLKQLSKAVKDLELADSYMKSANATTAGAGLAQAAKNTLTYAASSRPAALSALQKAGVPGTEELIKTLNDRSFVGADVAERIEKFKDTLKQFEEKASEFVKKNKKAVKAETAARMNDIVERLKKTEEMVAATDQKINDLIKKWHESPPMSASVSACDVHSGIATLKTLSLMQTAFRSKVQEALSSLPQEIKTAEAARGITALQKAAANAVHTSSRAIAASGHCFYDNYAMRTSTTMAKLTQEMLHEWAVKSSGTPTENVVEAAVNNTMSADAVTDIGFMATLFNELMQQTLQKLLDADGNALEKAAKNLGVSTATLDRLVRALKAMHNNGKTATEAVKIGQQTAALLAQLREENDPTDRQLFGEQIESKTHVLTGESIGHVNSEARNAAEEDYVAYLDHAKCRPTVVTRNETDGRRGFCENKLTVIQQIKKRNKSAIEQIRNALQFQSGKRTLETYGLRSGDLDEGSLHKLSYDCENIWAQKTISKLPDVAVGILVDQSGSMSGPKISHAREICVTLAEAIRKITGVRLYVYGHTANTDGDDVTIYEHYTPAMGADLKQLGGIQAHANNYDGYAIKDVAKRLSNDEAKRKYLFVIADGLPAGHGYGGESAAKHVTSVCKFTRERLKIGTYAFAVGVQGYQQAKFRQQYGDKHVVFVDNVQKCLPQIVRFLRNALQQERKLVGVAD